MSKQKTTMLHVVNLSVRHKTKAVVTDVSFSLQAFCSLSIIGPSGSGKTSLLKGLMGIADPLTVTGHVHFDDGRHSMHRPRFGYIPQDLALWPHLSVEETIVLAYNFAHNKSGGKARGLTPSYLLQECGLIGQRTQKPKALSGGEKQRLALARALVGEPSILILDEPFSGLDIVAKSELIVLITRLQKNSGLSIIFVSHDLAESLAIANQFLILDHGQQIWCGAKDQLSSERFLPHWNPMTSPLFGKKIDERAQ